jgi:hypothetical protein
MSLEVTTKAIELYKEYLSKLITQEPRSDKEYELLSNEYSMPIDDLKWIDENVVEETETVTREVVIKELCKFADVDYKVFIDKKFSHYIESKVRYHSFGKFRYEKIPFRKYAVAQTLKSIYDCKTYYLLINDDRLSLMPLWEKPDKIEEMIARKDRGDDKDLYAMYDINRFTAFKVNNMLYLYK